MKKIVIENPSPEFLAMVKSARERKEERMKDIRSKIPPIHIEILRFHNHHTKEETLLNYPEHEKFIDSIR